MFLRSFQYSTAIIRNAMLVLQCLTNTFQLCKTSINDILCTFSTYILLYYESLCDVFIVIAYILITTRNTNNYSINTFNTITNLKYHTPLQLEGYSDLKPIGFMLICIWIYLFVTFFICWC